MGTNTATAIVDEANVMDSGRFINRRRKSNFTMITNKVIQDGILSAPALALYILIAQKITIPGFVLYKTNLRGAMKKPSGAPMGQRAFQTVWDELKSAGYLKQFRIRTVDGFAYQYDLLEEPDHTRPPLVMVKLCERLEEDEEGRLIIRNIHDNEVEEEQLATQEDLDQADSMDFVGVHKDIEIVKPLHLTPEEEAYVRDYYANPKRTPKMYHPDPKFDGCSPQEEWKKKKEATRIKQQMLLEKYMPQLRKNAELDAILDESDRKIAEEVLAVAGELIAPPHNHMIPVCNNSYPQQMVLDNMLAKFDAMTLDRTIFQLRTYDKPIKNYRGFIRSTLYNNILTKDIWIEKNFNATYQVEDRGGADPDFMDIDNPNTVKRR